MALVQFTSKHTPGANWDYTVPFNLNVGVSIASASVAVVDSNGATVAGSDLAISGVSFGLISGTTYAVSFWASGGSEQTYSIAVTFTLSGSPVATGKRTVRLVCQQQV